MLHSVSRGFLGLGLCLLLLPSGACSGGTETGNPPFQAELSYTAYSSAPLLIGVREPGSAAVVDSAWLDLDQVSLLNEGECGEESPMAFSVPALGIGDHASGKHNVTGFELGTSRYCALALPFIQAPTGGTQGDQPPSLEQHSIMLAGSLADGTPFSLLSAATPTVLLRADAGSFEISPEHAKTLIAFDVAVWLADLDWVNATRIGGVLAIDAEHNPALLAQFEANLARGVALYLDRDGDGKLDREPERLAHVE